MWGCPSKWTLKTNLKSLNTLIVMCLSRYNDYISTKTCHLKNLAFDIVATCSYDKIENNHLYILQK
jgi:hypothetical protein